MAHTEEKVQTAVQLIEQVKTFYLLERKYLTIDATERITGLFSWLLLTFILIGVGLLVLMLLLITLIHALGSIIGDITYAYAIATGITLLLFALIWFNRKRLIVQPVSRIIADFLKSDYADPTQDPERAAELSKLPTSKGELRLAIKVKEHEIREQVEKLVDTHPKDDPSLGERLGQYVDKGLALYRGTTLTLGLINHFKKKKQASETNSKA